MDRSRTTIASRPATASKATVAAISPGARTAARLAVTHFRQRRRYGRAGTLRTRVEGAYVMGRIIGHYAHWFLVAVVGCLIVLTLVPSVQSHVGWQALIVLLAL